MMTPPFEKMKISESESSRVCANCWPVAKRRTRATTELCGGADDNFAVGGAGERDRRCIREGVEECVEIVHAERGGQLEVAERGIGETDAGRIIAVEVGDEFRQRRLDVREMALTPCAS